MFAGKWAFFVDTLFPTKRPLSGRSTPTLEAPWLLAFGKLAIFRGHHAFWPFSLENQQVTADFRGRPPRETRVETGYLVKSSSAFLAPNKEETATFYSQQSLPKVSKTSKSGCNPRGYWAAAIFGLCPRTWSFFKWNPATMRVRGQ